MPRLQGILKDKSPRKWLEDKGFVYHQDLGWVKRDRAEHCREKGYIRQDFEGQFRITKLGCDFEFLPYITGDNAVIIRKQGRDERPKQREAKKEVRKKQPQKVEASTFFEDMI